MTQANNLTPESTSKHSLVKPMLAGAVIGLLVISYFVFGTNYSKPEWGAYWRVRPIILTPIIVSMAGIFYYFLGRYRDQSGPQQIAAYIFGVLAYFIALWIGTILGLAGTMWN